LQSKGLKIGELGAFINVKEGFTNEI
jgi:hypothetical protein